MLQGRAGQTVVAQKAHVLVQAIREGCLEEIDPAQRAANNIFLNFFKCPKRHLWMGSLNPRMELMVEMLLPLSLCIHELQEATMSSWRQEAVCQAAEARGMVKTQRLGKRNGLSVRAFNVILKPATLRTARQRRAVRRAAGHVACACHVFSCTSSAWNCAWHRVGAQQTFKCVH